jgi:hypothetical protein
MRTFKRALENFFTIATSDTEKIYRQWDYQRARATGPNDLAEIDAIFARHLGRS